jgi:Raf kinase inhibitor-like YbhB/YbcL family protein
MTIDGYLRVLLVACGTIAALGIMDGAASAPAGFTLTSTTFKDGGMMPKRASNKPPPNPNCVGDNVSPQLSWRNAPQGTKSYAITIVDPEGYGGVGVVHWVAYGIPLNVTSFAEGEVSKLSNKFIGGKSTEGVGYYSGPCTPPGSPIITCFALLRLIWTRRNCRPVSRWRNCNPSSRAMRRRQPVS